MEEINRHSFQEALKKIDEDIKKRPIVAVLPTYQEKAFYLFNKSITAKEMNSFVSELQDKLLDTNIAIECSLNEVKGIYEALNKLDKDYIKGILASLKKANEAIDEVKKNTETNTNTIEALRLTVSELQKLQERVNALNEKTKEIEKLEKALKLYKEEVASLINLVKEQKADKSEISKFALSDDVYSKLEINKALTEKVDGSVLTEYPKIDLVFTKEEIDNKLKHLWIAYGITTATLLAGLIVSFLI